MIPSQSLTSLKITGGNLEQSELSNTMNLKPGRIVNAKVLDVTSQNRIQLLVDGQKLTVSTQLPLVRGMDIPMKVVRSPDGIVLKPIPTSSAPVSTDTAGPAVNTGRPESSVPTALPNSNSLSGTEKSLQTNAFQSFSLSKIFQGLNALSQTREPLLNDILMGLSLKSDVRDDQFLPQIIKNMGLSFEKKLAAGLEDASGQKLDKKTIAHIIKQLAGQDLKAAALSLAGMESDPSK
ncbi:MAG: hypothetical protein OQK71_09305, partial [Desulfobacter sp.]|nr:hypothetical protein [Desulfobacter sp.]